MAIKQTWWMLLDIQKLIWDYMLRAKSLSLWGTAKRNNFIESEFNWNTVKNTLFLRQRPQSRRVITHLPAHLRLKLTAGLALMSPNFRKLFLIPQGQVRSITCVFSKFLPLRPSSPPSPPGHKPQHSSITSFCNSLLAVCNLHWTKKWDSRKGMFVLNVLSSVPTVSLVPESYLKNSYSKEWMEETLQQAGDHL